MAGKHQVREDPLRFEVWRSWLLPALAATFAALLCLLLFNRTDRFLTEDSRFMLRRAELGALHSPDLRISGIDQAPADQVQALFAQDEGRSVFVVPLMERRSKLLGIRWIREARVSRIWPNQVHVQVEERVPAAFVHLAGRRGQATRAVLIDEDGVLLPLQERRKYDVPLLTGISEAQGQEARAQRVRLMKRLLADLAELGKPLSEIDLTDPTNLKVVYPAQPRAITLILGNRHWRARMEKFLRHYPEIQRKMPNAIQVDLRLEDRITATELEPTAPEADGH